jgi:hypothetical protein
MTGRRRPRNSRPARFVFAAMTKAIAIECLVIFAALAVVGIVSNGVIRHLVQTAPLWPVVVLGLRRHDLARWCALPCFAFWLFIMGGIWLFLLGWAHLVSGTFSPTEIAMTLVVGGASLAGIVTALRGRGRTTPSAAAAAFVLFGALQVIAMRISTLPGISHD